MTNRRFIVYGYRFGTNQRRTIYAPNKEAAILQAKLLGFINVKFCAEVI